MEKIAYAILLALAGLWLLAMIFGLIAAFPIGLIGFLGLIAIGLLFFKVVRDRIGSEEDDYYSKNVDR